MNATPCSSLGSVTRRAEGVFGGAGPAFGDCGGGGLQLDGVSSSALLTSNIPLCANLDPAEISHERIREISSHLN